MALKCTVEDLREVEVIRNRAVIYARYSSDKQKEASIEQQVKECSDYIARRIGSILDINTTYNWGRSSAQLRLLGNIGLFPEYDLFQKLFGLGVGEYANVFSGVDTTYGSSMVNMLLGFGLVGALALIVWSLFLISESKQGVRVFPVLVVLALFTDNVLFGWYFFYLLSWVELKPSSRSAKIGFSIKPRQRR